MLTSALGKWMPMHWIAFQNYLFKFSRCLSEGTKISNDPFSPVLQRFQDLEEAHLKQMKEFLTSYMEIVQNNFDLVGQVG